MRKTKIFKLAVTVTMAAVLGLQAPVCAIAETMLNSEEELSEFSSELEEVDTTESNDVFGEDSTNQFNDGISELSDGGFNELADDEMTELVEDEEESESDDEDDIERHNYYISTEEERNVEMAPMTKGVHRATNDPYYNAYDLGLLPPIHDQGQEGCCWAFANIGCVEADLIKDGKVSASEIDLSELNLAYLNTHSVADPKGCHTNDTISFVPNSSNPRWTDTGGNYTYSSRIFANGIGLMPESKAPYKVNGSINIDYNPDMSYVYDNNVAVITDSYEISVEDRDGIKRAIREHGGVAAAFYALSSGDSATLSDGTNTYKVCYNSTNNAFYGQVGATNHEVMLVGWDDNFSSSNFTSGCQPEGDGAWLVRNSWGYEGYGKRGYFWLSYYDAGLISSGSVCAYDAELIDNGYDNCYAYDGGMNIMYYTFDTSCEPYAREVFNVNSSSNGAESIEAVGYEVMGTNVSVGIDIIYYETASTPKTVHLSDFSAYEGFHITKLNTPIVAKGDVTVKISYSRDTTTTYVLIEGPTAPAKNGITRTASHDSTNSCVKANGYVEKRDADVKIKLFTNDYTNVPPVEKVIKLTKTSAEGHKGATVQLALTSDSNVALSELTWTSSNENCATVNSNGKITVGASKGSATITGTYAATGQTVECTVTVKPYTITYSNSNDGGVKWVDKTTEFYPGDPDSSNYAFTTKAYKEGYEIYQPGTSGATNGYTWYTNAACTQKLTSDTLKNASSDITLYPKWNELTLETYFYKPDDSLTYYSSSAYKSTSNSVTISDMPHTLVLVKNENNEESPDYYVKNYNSTHERKVSFDYYSKDAGGNQRVDTLTSSDFGFKQSSDGKSYTQRTTVYLYPQYSYSEWLINYKNLADGTNDPDNILKYAKGTTGSFTLRDPSRNGYSFEGWYDNSTYSGSPVTTITYANKDYNLYAKWKVKPTQIPPAPGEKVIKLTRNVYDSYHSGYGIQLQLTSDSDSDVNITDLVWNSSNTSCASVSITGYVTVGSSKGSAVITGTYPETGQTVECTVTVKPYTITYSNSNDGGVKWFDKTTEFYPGDANSNNYAFTTRAYKAGYEIYQPGTSGATNGYTWYTDSACTTKLTSDTLKNASSDITLYPKWKKLTYEVYFYNPKSDLSYKPYELVRSSSNCKTISDMPYTLNIVSDESKNESPNNVIKAYNSNHDRKMSFDYFSIDQDGKNRVDSITSSDFGFKLSSDGKSYTQTTRKNLFPQYSYSEWLINYNLNGGTNASGNITKYNKNATGSFTLKNPTRSGYKFVGWYTNPDYTGTAVTKITYANKDYDLYAKWEVKQTASPIPTEIPKPTDTPKPTDAPRPTDKPEPTDTPEPTSIPGARDVRERFVDVEDKWYVKAVQNAVDTGIMSGTGNGKFEPNTPCSRTMMVQMLYNMEGKPSFSIGNHFSDVNSKDWFYKAVLWAVENKVTSGTSPTTFGKGNVTREQMATFLMNYAKAKGYNTEGRNDVSRFDDSNQISGWALEAMKWANASGIINGTSATKINPKGEASRAEVAQMLMNFKNCFEP